MTVSDTRYAAAMAWVEGLVAGSTILQSTRFEFYTLDGQLWVQVRGSNYEAHAWHVAVGGLQMPAYFDTHGVRRSMILGTRVHVEIIDDPRVNGGV